MTLRWKYWLFLGALHAVIGMLAYFLFQEQRLFFLLAEAGILLSLLVSFGLYRSLVRPIYFMQSGIDAIRDQDFNVTFTKTGSREMDRLIGVYNEMIKNIRRERISIEEQHYFLHKLVQASPMGILLLDYDGRIVEINPYAEQQLGLEQSLLKKRPAETGIPLLQAVSRLQVGDQETLTMEGARRYKCQVSQFIHRGFQRRFLLIQDLSAELLTAEKKAYGKVIRMMAHEVNNSIGAINSILDSVAESLEETIQQDADADALSSYLRVAHNRNDGLNQFMRNFASVVRLPAPERVHQDLVVILRSVGRLFEQEAAQLGINLQYQLPERPVHWLLDRQQIDQALVNLLRNAMESIKWGGCIRLILQEDPLCIIVADNGPGISEEIAAQLFTPFFSTKVNGQGVGLTLVREIALHHEAHLSLRTEADGWTYCRLQFETLRSPAQG